jgi:hypothetical protein
MGVDFCTCSHCEEIYCAADGSFDIRDVQEGYCTCSERCTKQVVQMLTPGPVSYAMCTRPDEDTAWFTSFAQLAAVEQTLTEKQKGNVLYGCRATTSTYGVVEWMGWEDFKRRFENKSLFACLPNMQWLPKQSFLDHLIEIANEKIHQWTTKRTQYESVQATEEPEEDEKERGDESEEDDESEKENQDSVEKPVSDDEQGEDHCAGNLSGHKRKDTSCGLSSEEEEEEDKEGAAPSKKQSRKDTAQSD